MHHPSDVVGSLVNAGLCLLLAARVVLRGPLPEDRVEDPGAPEDDRGGAIDRSLMTEPTRIAARTHPTGARR